MQIEQMNPRDLTYTPSKRTDPKNPKLLELAKSVKIHGVFQPIIADEEQHIIVGRRRCAAAVIAEQKTVPVIVLEHYDEEDAAAISVVENLQRENLAPLEEAAEIKELLVDRGWKVEDVASMIGMSPTWVVRRSALTRLSAKWKKALTGKVLDNDLERIKAWPASWLELVARLNEEQQDRLLDEASWRAIEGRHELEQWIADETRLLKDAPFPLEDEALNPKRGACTACQERSSCHPGLFDDWDLPEKKVKATDKCLNPMCWEAKILHWAEHRRAALVGEHDDAIIVDNQAKNGTVHEYDVEKTKKGAKGARKVLNMRTGQEYWGKLHSWVKPSKSRVGPDGKKKPSTLGERRKKLEKRREALVNKWLREKLQDKFFAETAVGRYSDDKLLRHLEAFGTFENKKQHHGHRGNPWTGKPVKNVKEQLWRSIFKVMDSRLQYYQDPPAKEHEQLCKHHGDLFNVTLKGLRDMAAAEIPEPKSWAGLKADGTPKKKRAKKKGKK